MITCARPRRLRKRNQLALCILHEAHVRVGYGKGNSVHCAGCTIIANEAGATWEYPSRKMEPVC